MFKRYMYIFGLCQILYIMVKRKTGMKITYKEKRYFRINKMRAFSFNQEDNV